MKTCIRLVEMILRGKTDQFKNVMKEELVQRTSILLEKIYKNTSKVILEQTKKELLKPINTEVPLTEKTQENIKKFTPDNTYYLKDGNLGILNESEKELISKLYEKLNNMNKERMIKLLSESKESFNRVLNLAKVENKK